MLGFPVIDINYYSPVSSRQGVGKDADDAARQKVAMATLTKTGLGALYNMGDRLQDALVVQGAKPHAAAPSHLLKHGAPLVLLAELGGRGSYYLALLIRDRRVASTGSRFPLHRLALALQVQPWEMLPTQPGYRKLEALFRIAGRVLGPDQRWPPLGSATGGLRFDFELSCELMERSPCRLVHRRQFESARGRVSFASKNVIFHTTACWSQQFLPRLGTLEKGPHLCLDVFQGHASWIPESWIVGIGMLSKQALGPELLTAHLA